MKRIPLTRGKFAVVDDKDYPVVAQHKWAFQPSRTTPGKGYAIRSERVGGQTRVFYLHRELLKKAAKRKPRLRKLRRNELDFRRNTLTQCFSLVPRRINAKC